MIVDRIEKDKLRERDYTIHITVLSLNIFGYFMYLANDKISTEINLTSNDLKENLEEMKYLSETLTVNN